MWSSGYFAETAIFYAGLFCKTFCIFQSASSPKGVGSFSVLEQNVTPGFKEQSQVHLIHAPRRQHI
jgi:hypothetical protein